MEKRKKAEILALIPARAGSQRIKDKNIQPLAGLPLIAYTIQAASCSKYITRIIISTDSKKIATIANQFGAETPFLRPKFISQHNSTELQLFRHAITALEKQHYHPDLIVKLFPTSPFRTSKHIDDCIRLMLAHPEATCVRSVRLCKEHPYKQWVIQKGRLVSIIPIYRKRLKDAHTRSYCELPEVYVNNAAIDVIRSTNITQLNSVTGNRILPYIMSEAESLDINTPLDMELANMLLKRKVKE